MATKEPPAPPPPESGDVPKKRNKKLLVIGGVVGVLALAGVAATTMVVLKKPVAESGEAADEEKVEKKKRSDKPGVTPTFLTLDTFVVNLNSESGEQYLQMATSLELVDSKDADRAKAYMPKIRNQIMLLLSGKKPSELATKEGKEKLAAEIRDDVNEVLTAPGGGGEPSDPPVKEVLFTSFIIQ